MTEGVARWLWEKRTKGKVRRSQQGSAGEAPNLMRRPVRQGNRDATTSACVGWDGANIENYPAISKLVPDLSQLKWLHDHEDNNPDHQKRRNFIDNTVEFLAMGIPIIGKILKPAGKKTVNAGQDNHQQELAVKPAG
jgi:hypothetical protein